MIAAPNPLRSPAADADSVSDLVRTIEGPVVLVAHSYGGAVISNVAADAGEITGLVYVNGFAPDPGESRFALAGRFPGSKLGEETLRPVPCSDGTTDLYIVVTTSTTFSAQTFRRRSREDGGDAAARRRRKA